MGLIRHAHPRQQRSGQIRRLATDPDASGETFAATRRTLSCMPATAKIGRWSHRPRRG